MHKRSRSVKDTHTFDLGYIELTDSDDGDHEKQANMVIDLTAE